MPPRQSHRAGLSLPLNAASFRLTAHPGFRRPLMYALIAIGVCVGLFALLNIIEFRRID